MFKPQNSILFIALLGLIFFSRLLLHPTETLYSETSDLLTFHLPYKHFQAQSFQENGEMPLWCPHIFGGMPFVHDIGASVFYPLHLPLVWLPPKWLGPAMSWLIVLHVIIAGWCMYAFAWHRGLRGPGAFVAAVGYMLAGKWMLHLLAGGHYNMIALAWLPLVPLWLEQAIARKSIVRAVWAGAAFSLLILCAYPYVTLYAGLFVAVWTLEPALANAKVGAGLQRWAAYGVCAAIIAVLLGAAQLLPGLEMAAHASRSAGVGLSLDYFVDGFRTVVNMAGPPLSSEPNIWENRAGQAVIWLALIIAAALSKEPRIRFEVVVLIGLVAFSLGGAALVQWLPGFRFFRLPSRMLLIAALPAALLAGRAVSVLTAPEGISLELRLRYRTILAKVASCVLLITAVFTLGIMLRPDVEARLHPYWLALLFTFPCTYLLLSVPFPARYAWYGTAWACVLVLDVLLLSLPLVETRMTAKIFRPSACVSYLVDRRDERGRIIDFAPADFSTNHTPLWPGLAAVVDIEPLRGFNPMDVRRYKEYLQFMAGDDKPLQALDGMFTGPLVGSFAIKNQSLADLLGVRFMLLPRDVPLDEVIPGEANRLQWRKVSEDADPTTFDIISVQPGGRDCGMQTLPPYNVFENTGVLPRAFVVPNAAPMPGPNGALAALRDTDFRKTVLLERFESTTPGVDSTFCPASAIRYTPNRIDIEVNTNAAGYLVLADVWFPGWLCTVDDRAAEVQRANYLFRAVTIPAGTSRVVFRFAPGSVWWGSRISLGALVGVLIMTIVFTVGVRIHPQRHSRAQRKVDAFVS